MIKEVWHENMDSLHPDILHNAMNSSYCFHLMQDIVLGRYPDRSVKLTEDYQIESSEPPESMSDKKGFLAYQRRSEESHNIEIAIDHDSKKQGKPISRLELNIATPLDMPEEYHDFMLVKKAQMVVRNEKNRMIDIYNIHKNTNKLSRLAGVIVIDKTIFRNGKDYVQRNKDGEATNTKNFYARESTSIVDSDGVDRLIDLLPKYA